MKTLKLFATGLLLVAAWLPPCEKAFSGTMCDSLSVESINPDSAWASTLTVVIYNQSSNTLSYPYVDYILNEFGDTIADGDIFSFGQAGNSSATYQLSYINASPAVILTVCFKYNSTEQCMLTFNASAMMCDSLAITSMGFDSVMSDTLNVTVINKSNFFLNYPVIDFILNSAGDTVADGDLNSFGQVGNTSQTYQLSTSLFSLYGDYFAYFNYNSGEQCVLKFSVPAPPCDSLSVVSMAPDPDSAGMLKITVFNQSVSIWYFGHIDLVLNSNGDTVAKADNTVQSHGIGGNDSATFLLPGTITSLQENFTLYFAYDGMFIPPPPCTLSFNNSTSVPAPPCDSLSVVSMAPDPDSAGMLKITVYNQSVSELYYGHIGLVLNSNGDTVAKADNTVQSHGIGGNDSATFLLPGTITSLQENFTLYFAYDGRFIPPPPCTLSFNNSTMDINGPVVNRLNIYPNPVNRLGTLSIEGLTDAQEEVLWITNNVGQIVHREKFKNKGISFFIELSELNLLPGLYFLSLQTKENVLMEKMIVTQ